MTRAPWNFGLLFWINASAFGLYGAFLFLPELLLFPLGKYLQSAIALFIAFFIASQNILAILEQVVRIRFSLLEKFAAIPIVGLFASPLAMTLAARPSNEWLPFVPILLAGATGLLAIWQRPFFWEESEREHLSPHLVPAGLIGATLSFVFFFHLVTAYYALPDFDPYYWLQKFQSEYARDEVTDIGLHRPLFSSLGYIFFKTASIDLYAYFKYLLPALALLVFFPAALIANRMRRLSDAILAFLLPAVSGSFLLYSFSSIPQTILNLVFLAGTYFVTYALVTRRKQISFLAGGLFFLLMLYHEMSILVFLPWLVATVHVERHTITKLIRENPFASILAAILAVSHLFPALFELERFLIGWMTKTFHGLMQFHPNFSFPATYVNVDGNAVGWGNWTGVLRYYAFYLGPLVSLALIILFWRALSRPSQTLVAIRRTDIERTALGFFFGLSLIFFSLAELFPRFFNIALLPERAMGFFGFSILAFLMIVLIENRSRQSWAWIVSTLLIAAACINAAAALYINSEKRFLITPNQIASAEWIRGSLPANRVILSGSHWNLIRFHSQTESAIKVEDPLFYRDIRVFEAIQGELPSERQLYRRSFSDFTTRLGNSAKRLLSIDPVAEPKETQDELDSISASIQAFRNSKLPGTSIENRSTKPKVYVYYTKMDGRNPYANRPYMKPGESATLIVFDLYPDRFKRIYALPEDEVVIWELIQ